MDKSVKFWDRFANRYSKQAIADPDTYQRKLELTWKYLTPESRVFEFGCGTGSTALLHAPKVKHIVATDYSHNMIEIANRKLADTDLNNVEFKCATLFDLPYGDESFDAVLGLNVLHLINDPARYIEKAYALLKPGGVLITSTACLTGKFRVLKLVLPLGAALGLIPEVKFMTLEELEGDMTSCGFTLIEKLLPPKPTGAVFLIAKK